MRKPFLYLVFFLGAGLLSGCSSPSERHERIDYARAKQSVRGLDVPPDLTQPTNNDSMALPEAVTPIRGEQISIQSSTTPMQSGIQGATAVLPQQENIRILRDGSLRWLEINMHADSLWPKLRDFWQKEGLEVKRDEPSLGIMETEWSENRADIPEGFIRGLISKVTPSIYSAPTRDKYRIRIEPLEEGESALYLTHYGVEQVNVADGDTAQAVWKPRSSDLELSNEMLNRLLLSLGIPKEISKQLVADADQIVAPPRVRLMESGDEVTGVVMDEAFAPAWRRVGIVLDRLGLVVEDRNRSTGTYYVAVGDSAEEAKKSSGKGWFSSLFSSEESEPALPRLRIILTTMDGNRSEITVRRVDGGEVDKELRRKFLIRLRDGLI